CLVYYDQQLFRGLGFTKSEVDANISHIIVDGKILIIVLYVDDLILTGDDQLIKSCKEDLAREFEMKEMGLVVTHLFFSHDWLQKSNRNDV
ncbi:reverse transcriptase domain-containing protein, partial [Actinobacillus pleuropneumoniae]